jgi:hypothetical protein
MMWYPLLSGHVHADLWAQVQVRLQMAMVAARHHRRQRRRPAAAEAAALPALPVCTVNPGLKQRFVAIS